MNHSAHPDEPVDCTGTLLRLFEYLDGEMLADDGARIKAHLDECAQCLEQYRLDLAVKAAVKRSCACQEAPVALRQSIIARLSITRIRID